jgi:conjugative transposon TraM protein
MVKSYGKIQDYSAVENIDRDSDVEVKEDYTSKYTDYDLEFLDGTAANNAPISASASPKNQGNATAIAAATPADTRTPQQRQAEAIAELEKVIAASRNKNTAGSDDAMPRTPSTPRRTDRATVNERETRIDDRPTATEVVKKVRANSDYFNTIADGVPESNLIKAIIDENISAVDGSRIRLRLLDDIVINDVVIPGGTCLYASMNGFGSQRVKGSVTSIMVEGVPVTVNLSIYDTDGLEGLYVPSSSFRDTTKDIASGALGGNMSINTTSTGNSLSQWGMQAVQNAYQQTASAISKAVKKNRAKIKYGSFVYLVNAKDKTK